MLWRLKTKSTPTMSIHISAASEDFPGSYVCSTLCPNSVYCPTWEPVAENENPQPSSEQTLICFLNIIRSHYTNIGKNFIFCLQRLLWITSRHFAPEHCNSMRVEKASLRAQYVFENIFSYLKSISTHKLSLNIPSDATLSTWKAYFGARPKKKSRKYSFSGQIRVLNTFTNALVRLGWTCITTR